MSRYRWTEFYGTALGVVIGAMIGYYLGASEPTLAEAVYAAILSLGGAVGGWAGRSFFLLGEPR